MFCRIYFIAILSDRVEAVNKSDPCEMRESRLLNIYLIRDTNFDATMRDVEYLP